MSPDDDRTLIRHAIDEAESYDIAGEMAAALLTLVDRMPKVYAVRRSDGKYLARGDDELWVDSPAGSMYSSHMEASARARRAGADVITFVELPT